MATKARRKRATREPMSRVDTAWLRMERGTNPMMITGVLMFAEPMSLKALKQVVKTRFLDYARFRQKPVDTPAGAYWQDDEHFDLDWHVQLSALPGKGGKRALERFVSQLASSPLDASRPLWQFHLVEALRRRLRAGRAHPPQLRRRHGAGAGAAVADRHLAHADEGQRPRQGVAEGTGRAGRASRRRGATLR